MKYTKESLQKTWGLVESKEHADYISEKCKSVGLISSDTWRCEYGYFSISLNELLFWGDETYANSKGKKQITIPLPPKREEFPKQVIATGKIFNLDSDDLYRWVSDCGKMEVIRPLESLEGEGDFTILSCESSSDDSRHSVKPKRNKSKQAYEILKSLDYDYDLDKQRWYKKEYV